MLVASSMAEGGTVVVFGVLLTWAVMQWAGKLPHEETITAYINMMNTRGGNILILSVLSMFFFSQSMRLFYALLDASQHGTIQQDNAFALMALQFASASAFGGAFGALLKTMTGESSKARATDGGANAPENKEAPKEDAKGS